MIGHRLRELRTSKELSLRQLAQETGLSATLLSQIERGVTEPSLKSLRLIAEVFGQSIAALFQEDSTPQIQLSRKGTRSRIISPQGSIQYEQIMRGHPDMAVLHGLLEPGASSSAEPWSHPAIECAYVTVGTLTVEVGSRLYTVPAGDAITLDSRQPHRYINESNSPTEFILSVTPPTP